MNKYIKIISTLLLLATPTSLTGCAGLAELSGNVVGSFVRNI